MVMRPTTSRGPERSNGDPITLRPESNITTETTNADHVLIE